MWLVRLVVDGKAFESTGTNGPFRKARQNLPRTNLDKRFDAMIRHPFEDLNKIDLRDELGDEILFDLIWMGDERTRHTT